METPFSLPVCVLFAIVLEGSAIYLLNAHYGLFVSTQETVVPFAELEMLEKSEKNPEVVRSIPPVARSRPPETWSENSKAASTETSLPASLSSDAFTNRTEKGKPMSATHGPVLVDSPAPVIPDYLKNKDLSAKVLIEFTVLASGSAEPKLLVSSGDEELDQIALSAAKKWTFYPAESDHQAVRAKIRLRILFTVR